MPVSRMPEHSSAKGNRGHSAGNQGAEGETDGDRDRERERERERERDTSGRGGRVNERRTDHLRRGGGGGGVLEIPKISP